MAKKARGTSTGTTSLSTTSAIVKGRAGGRCERCGTAHSQFWSVHHRKPRGMGGSRDPELTQPSNLLLLCGSGTQGCHGWVESNRAEAYAVGLLIRGRVSPILVPVKLRYGLVTLDDVGGWQPC